MSNHCLSEEILQQMTEGRLPEPALSLSLIHLDECDQCQARFRDILLKAERPFATSISDPTEIDQVPAELLNIHRLGRDAEPGGPGFSGVPLFFSHFKVLSEISRGMNSRVLEALDTRLDRKVAIKILDREFSAGDPVLVNQFLDQARIVAQINHPAIVPIYDVGVFEEEPYIVMPLLEGGNLRARLVRGPIEPAETTRLASQLLDGLKAAHDFGVIHKDLKPENLWLKPGQDGRPQLIILDFGNAQQVNTVAATATGTPLYIAPEQVMRQQVDARTDFFALGTVLYEMLTGEPAWSMEAEQTPLNPAQDPRVPAAFSPVLDRLLALDPENRYADHESLKLDLFKALQKYEKNSGRKALRLSVVGVGFGLLAALSFYDTSGESGSKPDKTGLISSGSVAKSSPTKNQSPNELNSATVLTPKKQAKSGIKLTAPVIRPLDRFQVKPGTMMNATAAGLLIAKNAADGNFTIYDTTKNFELIASLADTGSATRGWISPNGLFVEVLTRKSDLNTTAVRVWQLGKAKQSRLIQHAWEIKTGESETADLAWMDRGRSSHLFLTSKQRTVFEYRFPSEGNNPPAQSSLKHLYANITHLYPQPGGDMLIGAKDSGGLDIFDTRRHIIKFAWRVYPNGTPKISWSPDPNFFVVTHDDTEIRVYDVRKAGEHEAFTGLNYLVDEVHVKFPKIVLETAFTSPNDLVVRTLDSKQFLYLYDIKSMSIRALIDTEGEPVETVVALPNARFATIGKTGQIRTYSAGVLPDERK